MDTLVLLQRGELREALVTLIAKDNEKGRVRGQNFFSARLEKNCRVLNLEAFFLNITIKTS